MTTGEAIRKLGILSKTPDHLAPQAVDPDTLYVAVDMGPRLGYRTYLLSDILAAIVERLPELPDHK